MKRSISLLTALILLLSFLLGVLTSCTKLPNTHEAKMLKKAYPYSLDQYQISTGYWLPTKVGEFGPYYNVAGVHMVSHDYVRDGNNFLVSESFDGWNSSTYKKTMMLYGDMLYSYSEGWGVDDSGQKAKVGKIRLKALQNSEDGTLELFPLNAFSKVEHVYDKDAKITNDLQGTWTMSGYCGKDYFGIVDYIDSALKIHAKLKDIEVEMTVRVDGEGRVTSQRASVDYIVTIIKKEYKVSIQFDTTVRYESKPLSLPEGHEYFDEVSYRRLTKGD